MSIDAPHWLYITPTTLDDKGGQSTHVIEFCRALSQKARVTLVSPSDEHFVASTGVVHVPVRLPRFAKGIGFDVHMLWWWLTKRIHPPPNVVYLRAGVFNFNALVCAMLYHVPCLMEINGDIVEEYAQEHPSHTPIQKVLLRFKLLLYTYALGLGFRAADALIVVTPDLRDVAIQRYGVAPQRIAVVPNGANVLSFLPLQAAVCRSRLGLPTTRRYLGYVGSLSPWQDIPTLIHGWAKIAHDHEDVDLIIVGDGVQRQMIESQAQALGVAHRLHMMGRVPHQDIPIYLNACDIFIAPKCKGRTDSPLKVYEAMSCGIPILASAQPGVNVVVEEQAGVTYIPGDVDDLTHQLYNLLQLPQATLHHMGLRGRHAIERYHSWGSVVDRVIAMSTQNTSFPLHED